MPKATDAAQRFYQNLVDIGCEEAMIQYCIRLKEEYRLQELLITLQRQRKKLLDGVHAGQQKVDCLDYLVNQIKKEQTIRGTK
ncbi:hypothetical protein KTH81_02245 [Lachnospiraceae bacterium ASD3451]|uniref:hypothetical protein n=1 Tax=Diplocloster agilis TaxID=2850323 RepID=UPI001D67FBC6|nr:hypothetical protein [Diplocloster agilis]MBU9742630.1 hypothetical protein [Diplocloster agilis]